MGRSRVDGTMADVLADERRGKQHRSLWSRMARNVALIPQRSTRTITRLCNPDFRLERTAERTVLGWHGSERRRELEGVIGTSSNHECRLLAYLASIAPADGQIVEIGAWKGRSATWLIEGSHHRREPLPVVSIDPHDQGNWEDFCKTVERFELVEKGLTVIRGSSHDVGAEWGAPISMLWIDGGHDYEDVQLDIDQYVPYVVPGGWIVFDDAAGGYFPGTEAAIADCMPDYHDIRKVAVLRHLQVFQRAENGQE